MLFCTSVSVSLVTLHVICSQERCQVFAAIAYAAVDNELAAPKIELTRRLLELLLQGCIMELKESGKPSFHYLNVFWFYFSDAEEI